jgi:hypothetical protein
MPPSLIVLRNLLKASRNCPFAFNGSYSVILVLIQGAKFHFRCEIHRKKLDEKDVLKSSRRALSGLQRNQLKHHIIHIHMDVGDKLQC